MFSSPNFGALFNLHSIIAYDVFETKQNYDSFLGKEHRTSPEISVLSKTLKKPRLLKRALFAMDLPEALSVSLLVFCFSFVFFYIAISRKSAFLFLRAPPQF